MNKEEILNTFLLANIPEIITQEEFNDVKKAIKDLQQENQKYKEVIDKVKIELEQGITFCKNDSQGLYDKCNIAINREQIMLDILKEVE